MIGNHPRTLSEKLDLYSTSYDNFRRFQYWDGGATD